MRKICVGTIPYAAYRWNSDITTATAVIKTPAFPASRLTAPSSSSMNSSAFFRASALMITSSSAGVLFGSLITVSTWLGYTFYPFIILHPDKNQDGLIGRIHPAHPSIQVNLSYPDTARREIVRIPSLHKLCDLL